MRVHMHLRMQHMRIYMRACDVAKWAYAYPHPRPRPLRPSAPCFNWQRPHAKLSPSLRDGIAMCGGLPGAVTPMAMPGNGTLSAVLECVHLFAMRLRQKPEFRDKPQTKTLSTSGDLGGDATAVKAVKAQDWGVLAIGDAPGFGSLVKGLPALAGYPPPPSSGPSTHHHPHAHTHVHLTSCAPSLDLHTTFTPPSHRRVVETSKAGAVAHTTFTGSCPPDSNLCVAQGTHDPRGGWTRAMIDYYLGGLTDGFVSVLFSSFTGAVLRRSLLCCKHRYHFGAMYSQQRSHRDKPMRNVGFLRAMMQEQELPTSPDEWGQAAMLPAAAPG